MSREYKARDKKVNKMTRDGLIERNALTGEEQLISEREQDFDLRKEQPLSQNVTSQKTPEISHSELSRRLSRDLQRDSIRNGEQERIQLEDSGSSAKNPLIPLDELQEQEEAEKPDTLDDEAQSWMEAAKPTKLSHEAKSHEKAAGPSQKKVKTEVCEERPGRLQFSKKLEQQQTIKEKLNFKAAETKKNELTPETKETDVETPNDKKQRVIKPDTEKLHTTEKVKSRNKQRKLRFSEEEKPPEGSQPDKKLTALEKKAESANEKLEKARDKLPSEKRAKVERVFDDKKGKAKDSLRFEKEILPPDMPKPLPPAPVALVKSGTGGMARLGAGKLRQKVYEVEHENVGVKAGHRTEQAAEVTYRGGKRVTHSAFSFARNRQYRTVDKLEKKAVKANVNLAYRKALNESPQLRSNIFSRYMQKRKIKQQYAKKAREAKRAAQTINNAGISATKAIKATAGIIRSHPVAISTIATLLLLILFLFSFLSSCSNMASGGLSAIFISSYVADDAEVDNSELVYTEWETDLQMQIGRTEQDYPGYDEYRYQVDNFGHNPYELMAFLTSVYQDFKYANVQTVLRSIFDEQYTLSFVPTVETKYADPDDSDDDGDYEPYDWYVLTVTLSARSFTDVAYTRMDAEQREIYTLLMQTKGNRQYIDSPFDFNWLPQVSSYYGYRVHPTSGVKDYHKGVDIAVPTGTEINAGHDGIVTFAGYNGDYGYVVVIEDAAGLVSKYAHCDSVSVSAGQVIKRGDVIALSGNTGNSTGSHLHLEVIKNGQYLNPLFFAETNDDGTYGPIYGYPGAPMGDGSYAALIEEAEKYLGYPYVWGGSNPSTSFDCSGFVSWVLNQSGVASVGRDTATGLYNQSTPVSPSDAQPGDLIFFHSTYSTTSPVTHVGIYVGNGMMLHCGNPIQYTSINTSYWQSHFFAFGRIN